MIRTIALALTVAAISTSATAQTNKQTWNDLLKPYEAKTNPAVPIAPPSSAVLSQPMTPKTRGGDNAALLDGCVIEALGRLPKVDGLRVTKSSYEYRDSVGRLGLEFWHVYVSVDLHGRQSNYNWLCRIYENRKADLLRDPN